MVEQKKTGGTVWPAPKKAAKKGRMMYNGDETPRLKKKKTLDQGTCPSDPVL